MRFPLRLILLLVILAEVAGFVIVGSAIGLAPTLALVLASMVTGVFILRRQGLATLKSIRSEMDAGRAPARPLFDGAVVAFAALLLIVPGFLTDIAGILLFIPRVRTALWRRLSGRLNLRRFTGGRRSARGTVVDLEPGEYAASAERESPWRRALGED